MAGPFKTILTFGHPKGGWGEIFYSAATDVTTAFNAALALARVRAAMMAPPTELQYIRQADEANPRAASVTAVNLAADTTVWTSEADLLSTAALIRLYATADSRNRPIYCRGNPDDAYDQVSPNNPDAQLWNTRLNAFIAMLKTSTSGSSWQIKVKPRLTVPPAPANFQLVNQWTTTVPSKNTLVHYLVDPGYQIGQMVTFYGVEGLPFAPGLCRIVDRDITGLIFTIRYRTPADFVYAGGAKSLLNVPSYKTVDAGQLVKFTKHSTGRPFGATRGRRRSISR
jgi:hypothetical protein